MSHTLLSSVLVVALAGATFAAAPRRPRHKKPAPAGAVERLIIAADRKPATVPTVTARVGQATAIYTTSAVRRITFGDDTCLTPKESDPGTPAFVAYLQPSRPCPVQNMFVETADGVTELNLRAVAAGAGAFTREVRITSARADDAVERQRAEIRSWRARQAELMNDLQNARAAASEAARLIPLAKEEGMRAGVREGLAGGAAQLAAVGERPRKTAVMKTARVKIEQLGAWRPSPHGVWGRFVVENRTNAPVAVGVEVDGASWFHVTDAHVPARGTRHVVVLAETGGAAAPAVRFTLGGDHVTSK